VRKPRTGLCPLIIALSTCKQLQAAAECNGVLNIPPSTADSK